MDPIAVRFQKYIINAESQIKNLFPRGVRSGEAAISGGCHRSGAAGGPSHGREAGQGGLPDKGGIRFPNDEAKGFLSQLRHPSEANQFACEIFARHLSSRS